jgi:tripartite-type tricarboxylate transporter receptor subunit TctC
MFASVSSSIEFVKAGKVRALAATTRTDLPALKDIPLVADVVPGYETSFWQGLVAPKGTPAEIVDRLNREVNAGLTDPKFKALLDEHGVNVIPGSPADFAKLIADETERWGNVIRTVGIKAE